MQVPIQFNSQYNAIPNTLQFLIQCNLQHNAIHNMMQFKLQWNFQNNENPNVMKYNNQASDASYARCNLIHSANLNKLNKNLELG